MDLLLVFFVYGLAFFTLGLAMLLESTRSPLLAGSRVLLPLALFGLIHGVHEWVELIFHLQARFSLPQPAYLNWIRAGLLGLSFVCLIVYSLQVLHPEERGLSGRNQAVVLLWAGLYIMILILLLSLRGSAPSTWARYADILARYLLGVPAAALAAIALLRQANEARRAERSRLAGSLRLAALGFALYCLTQVFVPPADLFPATVLNSALVLETTGLPVQALRTVLALLITVSLIRSSQHVEAERQAQLLAAQDDRLEALEQIRLQMEERERLRRELLRHTVSTQEEERARIARELHDETAQFLTALNLNLAALGSRLPPDQESGEQMRRLSELVGEMSQGIYRMVRDLRPAQLDDLGLGPALQYLADDVRQRAGLQVTLSLEGTRQRLDPLVETVLFRVAQEALANTARHARCSEAALRLCYQPDQVVLEVFDSGAGFDPQAAQTPPRGWGLAGMRERTESAGGSFEIRSSPGGGTRVTACIPLRDISPSH
jgi:two-component system sensor histidine kinase UhpB